MRSAILQGWRVSGFGPGIVDLLREGESGEARRQPPDLAMALDAIYAYATDPENWEEMTSLLAHLDADDDGEMGTVIEGVRQHIARAEMLAQRLHDVPDAGDPTLSYCHMAVGRDRRVLDISAAAAAMLLPYCGKLEAGTLLSFDDPENAARFRALAVAIEKGRAGDGPVLLRLVSETGEEAIFGYVVAETQMPDPLRRRLGLATPARKGALVFIAPDREAAADDARMYRETFGLTLAEARLAARLKDGLSLKEAAADLNIAVNTARNQIKSVFEKLGVNRQSDLVRHLTELSQLAAYIRGGEGVAPARAKTPLALVGLPDGRKLACREYGRPDGVPVVLLPSSVSSSHIWEAEAGIAARIGLRLIVVERPGTGASTADPDLTFESFARDLADFADALGLGRFRLLARSSAAPFGLAAAARMGSRVERLMLTSTRLGVPEGSSGKPLGMLGFFFNNLRRYPWLLDSTLFILRAKMSRAFIRPLILKFFETSPVDVELIRSTPTLSEAMVTSVMETVAHTYAGLLRESQLFLDGISLDLSGLAAPVILWHGEADGIVPLGELRRRLVEVGIEPAEMRTFPGEGHCFLYRHHEEIFRRLLEV